MSDDFEASYERIKLLGEGAFGTAYLVRPRVGPRQFQVAKEIRTAHLTEKQRQGALAEAEVLRMMSHPNIIAYIASWNQGSKLYIIMEYADGGDLSMKIKERKEEERKFEEWEIMFLFVQVGLALLHIHANKVLHRDLKPLNIFLTQQGVVKLGDFGIARILDSTTAGAQTTIGTPFYLSPEMCNSEAYGVKSDLWSLGVVTFELAVLRVPFSGSCLPAVAMKICGADPDPLPKEFSEDLSWIVANFLAKEPAKRPDLEKVLRMPYVQRYIKALRLHIRSTGAGGCETMTMTSSITVDAADLVTAASRPTGRRQPPLANGSAGQRESAGAQASTREELLRGPAAVAEFHRVHQAAQQAKLRAEAERRGGEVVIAKVRSEQNLEEALDEAERRKQEVRRRGKAEKEQQEAAQLQELERIRKEAAEERKLARQRFLAQQNEEKQQADSGQQRETMNLADAAMTASTNATTVKDVRHAMAEIVREELAVTMREELDETLREDLDATVLESQVDYVADAGGSGDEAHSSEQRRNRSVAKEGSSGGEEPPWCLEISFADKVGKKPTLSSDQRPKRSTLHSISGGDDSPSRFSSEQPRAANRQSSLRALLGSPLEVAGPSTRKKPPLLPLRSGSVEERRPRLSGSPAQWLRAQPAQLAAPGRPVSLDESPPIDDKCPIDDKPSPKGSAEISVLQDLLFAALCPVEGFATQELVDHEAEATATAPIVADWADTDSEADLDPGAWHEAPTEKAPTARRVKLVPQQATVRSVPVAAPRRVEPRLLHK